MIDKQMHEGEQTLIWDHFQNEGVEAFSQSRARLKYIVRQIDPGLKLLNIGIGGAILEELALRKGIDVHSLDPSERTIKKLRNRFDLGEKAKIGYSEQIPFEDGMFDIVVMSEVLEHLTEPEFNKTMNEVMRVLNEKGIFIVTVPFQENLLDNEVICPHCWEQFHRWGHKQSFSISVLQRLLQEKGFDVDRIETRCFPDWSRKGAKNKIKSYIRNILGRFGVRIAQPSIFVRTKKR